MCIAGGDERELYVIPFKTLISCIISADLFQFQCMQRQNRIFVLMMRVGAFYSYEESHRNVFIVLLEWDGVKSNVLLHFNQLIERQSMLEYIS